MNKTVYKMCSSYGLRHQTVIGRSDVQFEIFRLCATGSASALAEPVAHNEKRETSFLTPDEPNAGLRPQPKTSTDGKAGARITSEVSDDSSSS